jgi:hypothetical protein
VGEFIGELPKLKNSFFKGSQPAGLRQGRAQMWVLSAAFEKTAFRAQAAGGCKA